MDYLERVTFNPEQCGGRPCVRGMRIRVKDVLEMLAGGASEAQILADYPDLEIEDIRACLQLPPLKPITPCSKRREADHRRPTAAFAGRSTA